MGMSLFLSIHQSSFYDSTSIWGQGTESLQIAMFFLNSEHFIPKIIINHVGINLNGNIIGIRFHQTQLKYLLCLHCHGNVRMPLMFSTNCDFYLLALNLMAGVGVNSKALIIWFIYTIVGLKGVVGDSSILLLCHQYTQKFSSKKLCHLTHI